MYSEGRGLARIMYSEGRGLARIMYSEGHGAHRLVGLKEVSLLGIKTH